MGFRRTDTETIFSGVGLIKGQRVALYPGNDAGGVLTWLIDTGSSFEIRASFFPAVGAPIENFLVGSGVAAIPGSHPGVKILANGNFVIAWEGPDLDGSGSAMFARFYNNQGDAITDELILNTSELEGFGWSSPDISQLPDGRVLISGGEFVRVIDADGTVSGESIGDAPFNANFLPIADGRILVTFANDNGVPGDGPDSAGVFITFVNSNFDEPDSVVKISSRVGDPTTVQLADGRFAVVFAADGEVFGQLLDSAGNRIGNNFIVNTTREGIQHSVDALALPDGSFVTVWQTGNTIFGRIINTDGTRGPNDFIVARPAGADAQPQVQFDPNGQSFIVTFVQNIGGGETAIVIVDFDDMVDRAPTGAVLQGFGFEGAPVIFENAHADDVVGQLSALDPDLNGAHTFTLINNAGGRFVLDGNLIRVANGVALDFEQATSHTITVRVTDERGFTFNQNLSISVLDEVRDFVDGTAGRDTIYGGALADRLFGREGNDVLFGLAGTDVLDGGAGGDILNGGAGGDYMAGGSGNDTYRVDNSLDRVVDAINGGNDRVISSVTYTLGVNVENLTLSGSAVINGTGNSAANTIIGNSQANVISGLRGNDTLRGNGGADTFVFNTTLGSSNVDTIDDFVAGQDRIQLSSAIFDEIPVGPLDASAFRDGSRALDDTDRIIYDTTTGALFYDADGNGAGLAIRFATLDTGLTLSEADFIVV